MTQVVPLDATPSGAGAYKVDMSRGGRIVSARLVEGPPSVPVDPPAGGESKRHGDVGVAES